MAKRKTTRRRAKPLLEKFTKSPISTSKQEWRKLGPVGKSAVALVAIGFTGIGASEVVSAGKLGQAVSPLVQWGAKLRAKLG